MPDLRPIILARMAELGMTQTALAKAIGASRPTLNNWLRGRSTVTVETLVKVAGALGLEVRLVRKRKSRG